MGVEYRDVRLLETKALAETPGAFSGYGAVFGNVDDGGDIIRQGAFQATLREWQAFGKYPPMLLQHGGLASFAGPSPSDLLPVGEWTDVQENTRGLKVDGRLFALSTDLGQYLYEGLKAGALDGLSIGYKTRDALPGTRGAERILIDIALIEISIVTFPANPKARVTAVKALTHDELRDLEDALRDGGMSRTDCRRAVTVFKQWLQRDAGEPSGQRDAVAAGELRELLDASRRTEAVVLDGALQGLQSTIAAAGGR